MNRILAALAAIVISSAAWGQSLPFKTPGGQSVDPIVQLCTNALGQAIPCTVPIGTLPGTTPPDQSKQLFVDDFSSGTLNIINRWQSPTSGTGGTNATNATGATLLQSGTSANGFSRLLTQLTFFDKNPGYLFFQANINLSSGVNINSLGFIGFGTIATTPTAAAYCTDCVGFEDGVDGKLRAVTWASGARTVIADLSVAQTSSAVATVGVSGAFSGGCGCVPQHTDTGSYKYVIFFRGDNILWYIENQTNGQLLLVAFTTRGSAGPDVNQLPGAFLMVNNTTGPAIAPTMQINQVTVADTAGNPTTAVSSVTGSAAPSLILKAAAGHLIAAYANCTAACWLMIFNSATVPGDGATTAGTASGGLQDCIPIAAAGVGGVNYAPQPLEFFSVGITAVISSTACGTKTAASTGFIHGTVQ